ncbi:IS30 family transposase [Xanthomonas arboricola]|nr:helix-turn-helix domain-containing protein [Xanthomonas arboricola]MBB5676860.1 IS30 family transposase [Xanthomonas arboricola]
MYYQLTEPERYTLSVLKRQGCSLRGIARILKRHPSTISREVRRNATVAQGKPRPLYVPSKAQEHANGRRSRSRRVKQHGHLVYAQVESLLVQQQWSPEQIAHHFPARMGVDISPMTICRHVRRDQRQGGQLY